MASWFDLKGTFQTIFKIGKSKTVIDASTPTIARNFYMPDAEVDLRNGTDGQMLAKNSTTSIGWSDVNAKRMLTRVFNDLGSTVAKAKVVYLNGVQGDRPKIALSQANNEMNSSKTFGLTYAAISNMSDGQIISEGLLDGLNTDIVGWTEGDALWLSPSSAGDYTNVKPSAPDHAVFIGTLVRKHITQGSIQVKVQNGYELQELHNVSIPTTPSNGQVLTYNSSTSLWYAATPSGGGSSKFTRGFGVDGYATVGANKSLPILIPSAVTIQSIKAYARTAPVGAALLFDINKNGTTIFSTPGDRLSIASGANTSTVGTFSTSLAVNDVLELDIDQVGSSTFGSDITIVIEVQ